MSFLYLTSSQESAFCVYEAKIPSIRKPSLSAINALKKKVRLLTNNFLLTFSYCFDFRRKRAYWNACLFLYFTQKKKSFHYFLYKYNNSNSLKSYLMIRTFCFTCIFSYPIPDGYICIHFCMCMMNVWYFMYDSAFHSCILSTQI